MEIGRSLALAILIAISGIIVSADNSSASPIAKLSTTSLNLVANEQLPVLNVKLFKRGHKRRNGRRHHRRYRGHGGYNRYDGYGRYNRYDGFGYGRPVDRWYPHAYDGLPENKARPQFNLDASQCTKWVRACRKNWRARSDINGCMRFHRCR